MNRAGLWGLAVVAVAAPAVAAPDAGPYGPQPFTRFPDEPADPPPPVHHDDDTPTVWPAVLHAFDDTTLAVLHAFGATTLAVLHAFDGTTLEFFTGLNAPLELAAGVELVLPWRIRLGTSLGVLPRSVERAANTQLVEHGAYARSLGDLVDASMDQVLLWNAHLAVQPWKRHGFLATVGYGTVSIHGSATVLQATDALGMMIPDCVPVGDARLDLRSRLHLFDAELGWEWRWHRHWSLRVDLGAAITLSARTRVTVQPAIDDTILHDFLPDLTSRVEAKLDHEYTTYVKTPLLAAFIGYRL
ncbi:MAG TPA: hypothetical protein VH165_14200 [Kofleriaceae bacterium]|jgi:hypothetical protein|nr:hypothetical protein [Kofleriaceae bacterium]